MDKIENEKAAGGVETKSAAGDELRRHSTTRTTNSSNSASAQRARLLQRLKVGPVDTLEARSDLDIMHPAARCMELRNQYRIDTVWVMRHTDAGKPHRVALYVLHGAVRHE